MLAWHIMPRHHPFWWYSHCVLAGKQGLRELSESDSESHLVFLLFVEFELPPSSCPSSSCDSTSVKDLPVHSLASVKSSDGDGVRRSLFFLYASSSLPVRGSAEDARRFIASVVRRKARTELDDACVKTETRTGLDGAGT